MPVSKAPSSKKRKSSGKTSKLPKRASKAPKSASRKSGRKSIGVLFEGLVAVQARLRAPNGCPWDRQQTHESLRTYLIEEAYEVLDALDSGDAKKFAGELGDVLLQVVFHAELASETGRFDIGDVIEHVHNKMVRRHPHVFGNVRADTSAQVLKNWEELKAEERRAEQGGKGPASDPAPASVLDGVPRTLPALLEAHQLTRRASNVGFDWKHSDGLFEKLAEEAGELHEAVLAGDRTRQEEEAGDLLFVCVNIARFLGLDAEITLKKANRKFSRRFRDMERSAAVAGRQMTALSPDELESLWREAKERESR